MSLVNSFFFLLYFLVSKSRSAPIPTLILISSILNIYNSTFKSFLENSIFSALEDVLTSSIKKGIDFLVNNGPLLYLINQESIFIKNCKFLNNSDTGGVAIKFKL